MLKNILKLDGAQKLSKNEQKSINGGFIGCFNNSPNICPIGQCCLGGRCRDCSQV